jgi:hypothetical protein
MSRTGLQHCSRSEGRGNPVPSQPVGWLAWSPVEERAVADRFCECQPTVLRPRDRGSRWRRSSVWRAARQRTPRDVRPAGARDCGRAGAVTEANRIAAALKKNVKARRRGCRACRSRPMSWKKSTATILAPHGRVLRWPLCPPILKTKSLGFRHRITRMQTVLRFTKDPRAEAVGCCREGAY